MIGKWGDMRRVRNKAAVWYAFRVEENDPIKNELIRKGWIKENEDGRLEVFSREASEGSGELASPGDYIKIDSSGRPYPNKREYFETKHRHIGGNYYKKLPVEYEAWAAGDEIGPEMQFLIEKKGLILDADCQEKYFRAPIWGSVLCAAKDAVLVFYKIERDEDGKIRDIDFNFVARDEFDKTYEFFD